MPTVENHVTIAAPLAQVWSLAQEVERFPDFMPDLDRIQVIERQTMTPVTMRVVTSWHGRIRQFNRKMEWTEEDIWNTEDHTCRFWQLQGDFNSMHGEWKFTAMADSTQADLMVEYRFDIPLLGALMGKVLQKLMQANIDQMLGCLKAEAERKVSDQSSVISDR